MIIRTALLTTLLRACVAAFALAVVAPARADGALVLYAAAHEPTVRRLAEAFEQRSGVKVSVEMVSEGGGLVDRLEAEKSSPRADVVWVRDHVEAARAAGRGLLATHASPTAQRRPRTFSDPQGRWHGFSLRARALVYRMNAVPNFNPREEGEPFHPDQMRQCWHPSFGDGGVMMARVTSGGSRAQCAALLAAWGRELAELWAFQMRRQQMRLVASEEAALASVRGEDSYVALVDSDSYWLARERGWDLGMTVIKFDRYTVQYEIDKTFGPLLIPSAVGLVAGGPNSAAAARFADFLLSPEAERLLASAGGRCVPIDETVAGEFPELRLPLDTAVDAATLAENADAGVEAFRAAIPE